MSIWKEQRGTWMASKTSKLPAFMSSPNLDYCTARILSLAKELAGMGYKHHTIARAALNAGLEQSRVNLDDHIPYLRLLEEVGRETLAELAAMMAESESAAMNEAAGKLLT